MLAVARLSTYIHDTHAVVSDAHEILSGYFGSKTPPVEFLNIDGQIVISATDTSQPMSAEPLMPGDIVLSIDGDSIDERIGKCKEYISISNEDRFVQAFRFCLLGTDKDTVRIEVLRDGERLSLNVSCFAEKSFLSGQESSGFMKDEQIGYINPGKQEKGEIDKLMEQFSNTKGLVVDLRNYPSDFMVYTLAEYLIPSPVPFTKIGHCNAFVPGNFVMMEPTSSGNGTVSKPGEKPIYQGKVVLLMSEATTSQPEFTIMSLRNAPNAVVLGSPSNGSDGNVVNFTLPGNVSTRMSGLSIFYPDGSQTQRVGLEPDIYMTPTVAGIRDGKDELVNKAVSIICGD